MISVYSYSVAVYAEVSYYFFHFSCLLFLKLPTLSTLFKVPFYKSPGTLGVLFFREYLLTGTPGLKMMQ